MYIKFLNRMKKSYRVELSTDIKFNNSRGGHVETDMDNLMGKTFFLGQRMEKCFGNNKAVMYQVIGVTNNGSPAHLTVYFGPNGKAKKY